MRKFVGLIWLAVLIGLSGWRADAGDRGLSAPATENTDLREEVEVLRAQIAAMSKRLEALEARLGTAAGSRSATTSGDTPASMSESPVGAGALSAETSVGHPMAGALARPLSAPVSKATSAPPAYWRRSSPRSRGVIVKGIQGVPKVFIPDIGAVGDFTFRQSDLRRGDPRFNASRDKFIPRDTQLIFFSPIDPYTVAQISIDKPDDGSFDIEEAFLLFNKLPWDLTVRMGQFRPRFGLINEVDTFQLPTVERPQALARYLGQDGLVEPGVNLAGYLPNPWEANLRFDLDVVSGRNEVSFNRRGGRNFDFAYLGNIVYARDLFSSGSLVSGISFGAGPGPGGEAYLQDSYLQLQYAPSQRSVWTWSIEGLLAERKGVGDHGVKRGLYSLLAYHFWLRYEAALLIDLADVPNVARGTQVGLSPILTYFVSDNTRLRLEYTYTTGRGAERARNQVFLQATFSLGNLKPLD